ncbi:hypothetical protein RRG08_060880 [Elysia crispata]|uniref:Uncharacterized protein n=1 Tax=Elysia crispata TaxID=231223 RepID=A0AAE0ZFJ9_9GAST|nr:hypothetical protein RRG08_060880 [Elysia crispata]
MVFVSTGGSLCDTDADKLTDSRGNKAWFGYRAWRTWRVLNWLDIRDKVFAPFLEIKRQPMGLLAQWWKWYVS